MMLLINEINGQVLDSEIWTICHLFRNTEAGSLLT